MHYDAAVKLDQSRDWLEHSETVISNIQIEQQRLDRIEPAVRLFHLTQDDNNLQAAQTNSVALHATALHLQQLLADNPQQASNTRNLVQYSERLMHTLAHLSPQDDPPAQTALACRETLSLMQTLERELLTQRTDDSKVNASRNILLSIAFTALSMLVVIVLFGFLIRDAFRRRRDEGQIFEANEKLAGSVRALERQARESELITSARDELQLCVNSVQAWNVSTRYLEQLLPGTSGAMCLINHSRQSLEISSVWNRPTNLLDGFALDACCGLRSGMMRWRKSGYSEVHCSHFSGAAPENYLCLPLSAHGETLGIVMVECASTGLAAMVDANLPTLQQLVTLAAIAIAGLNLRMKLEHQSIRDGLTGLFNRHFMEIALDREMRRAERQQKPLAVLMLDVDHFKQFNDTYGHEAGDTVLREVAETLRLTVRTEDIVCRYGGEEFVVILPEVNGQEAVERADRIRQMVGEVRLRFRAQSLREITISAGVAVYPDNADTLEQLLRLADRALYAAKHQGRNRVVLTPTQRVTDVEASAALPGSLSSALI